MKKRYKILLSIVILLVVIRLILPYVVLFYANKTLAHMKGYYGHIDDVDLALYRGAYTLKIAYLDKVDTVSKKHVKFFKSQVIDLAIEWKSLFKGSVVGSVVLKSPELYFTKDKAEIKEVKKDTNDFRKLLRSFMPIKINRFELFNGSLHYVDQGSKPKVDIALTKAHILAINLSNVVNPQIEMPSTVKANAMLYEGTLDFNMRLNTLAPTVTFDLNSELKNTNMVLLNDFLNAYGKFDVNKGNFSLYAEMAAKNGKFKGYLKPIIKNLDVRGPEDKNDPFFHKVWESVVGTVAVIFKNQRENQLATKVNIEGEFKHPETDTFEVVWEVIRNAFIQALVPKVENEINIKSLKKVEPKDDRNLLQRIFGKKKKKEDKKEDKKVG